ncbi:MAG: helix-turn-helix transcriptional regulator, partial [Candidatus Flemingibacterium sp.]|nr:helix-turn-helix transcriptional regulator [Candidatus Flemingibacterium sp.]
LFRVRYGMTPERFLSECRFDKAQRLLRTTALDIKTIAALCGFDDATYFARWFKKHFGGSATDYRVYLEEISKRVSDGKEKRDEGE